MLEGLFSQNSDFSKFMNFLWNIILISLLWLVCSIPVVTIGASSTAAYYTAAKVVRHNQGSVISEFLSSFRRNWKQATAATVGYGLALLLLLLDYSFFMDGKFEMSNLFQPILLVLGFIVVAHSQYVFPVISRFDQSLLLQLRMAFVFVFRHLLTSVLLVALLAAAIALGLWLPWAILLIPGFVFYVQTFFLEKVLKKYAPPPTGENADKWYYQ